MTGLVRRSGLVFHIVENSAQLGSADSHLGTLIHGAGWGAVSQKVLGRSSRGSVWLLSLSPLWGLLPFDRRDPWFAPLRQAQGRLWAAFLRRFAAALHCVFYNFDLQPDDDPKVHIRRTCWADARRSRQG